MEMGEDSDLRAILKLLQITGLAPYYIGKDRRSSKKSFVWYAYNLVFAAFVMYNMIWAESDYRNDVDYPNKSFLISIAFDTVDVLENIHICFVCLRSLIFTNAGLGVWFKMKHVNQKLKELNVKFDDRKFKLLLYLKTVAFVILALLFLAADIILCSRLNMYYTLNYWLLSGIPLIHNSVTLVTFAGFTYILYQRFWAINEFLNRAIDCKDDIWSEKAHPQKNLLNEKSLEYMIPAGRTIRKCYRIHLSNFRRNRIRPPELSTQKKPPSLLMLKNAECFETNLRGGTIRSLKILHYDLFEVVCDLNSIFGWNLLFTFATSFFGCTINMYFVIIFHLRSYDAEQYFSCLFWMMAYLFKVFYLMASSNKASKEARKTTYLLHVLLSQTDVNDTQLQYDLRSFCLQNSQCKVKFQAAEFFTVDRTLLFQFIAGVLSNVVFVVQFDKINFSKK